MEPIEHKHLLREPRSQARNNLILKWLFLGTLLALMYRSVLLATLVSVDYEKQIDTVEDLLVTEKPILMARGSIQLQFNRLTDWQDLSKDLVPMSVLNPRCYKTYFQESVENSVEIQLNRPPGAQS